MDLIDFQDQLDAALNLDPNVPAFPAPAANAPLLNSAQNVVDWMGEHVNATQPQVNWICTHIFAGLGTLFTLLRLTWRQKFAVLRQGAFYPAQLRSLGRSYKDVKKIFSDFNTMPTNRGGTPFGVREFKAIWALVLWSHECYIKQVVAQAPDFTREVYQAYSRRIDDGEEDLSAEIDTSSESKKPIDFDPTNYEGWYESLMICFRSKASHQGSITMEYIDKDRKPDGNYDSEAERMMCEARHQGATFNKDNHWCGTELIAYLTGTEAEHWIRPFVDNKDGRGMLQTLTAHYMGDIHKRAMVEMAKKKILEATYSSEYKLSFSKFTSQLRGWYNIINRHREYPVSNADMVSDVKDSIKTNNPSFNAAAVTLCMQEPYRNDFNACIGQILGLVQTYFSSSDDLSGRRPGRARVSSLAATHAQHEEGGKYFYNGVDITDFTRRYAIADWQKLKPIQQAILAEINKKKKKGGDSQKTKKQAAKKQSKAIKQLKAKVASLESKSAAAAAAAAGSKHALVDDDDSSQDKVGPQSYNKKSKKKKKKSKSSGNDSDSD